MKNICAILIGCVLAGCGAGDPREETLLPGFSNDRPLPAWQTLKEQSQHVAEALRSYNPPASGSTTPAEWEASDAVLVKIGMFNDLASYYGALVAGILRAGAKPHLLVNSNLETGHIIDGILAPRGIPSSAVTFHTIASDSIWTRDYGPWTMDVGGRLELADPLYFPGRPNDDRVPIALADRWGRDVYTMPVYTEGGNFMTDGRGTCWISRGVLYFNDASQSELRQVYRDYVGCETLTFVEPVFQEGTTHIDMLAKVLDEDTILVGYSSASLGANTYEIESLEQAAADLADSPKPGGGTWEIVAIPMSFGYDEYGQRVYFTHTNSLIANDTVLVPTYQVSSDSRALEIYRERMPDYDVVGIDSSRVIPLGGAVHCTAMQLNGSVAEGDAGVPPSSTGASTSGVSAPDSAALSLTHSDEIAAGQWHQFEGIEAGPGIFRVVLSADADADLYVRRGASPGASSYDCRPYLEGDSSETCELSGPGLFFIGVNGYDPVANYQLDVSYRP